MKNRNLFTNILSIVILLALVFFLLIQFNVFKVADNVKNAFILASLGVAVLSVVFIDIVFPIIDNRHRLAEKKYLILFIVKVVLFMAAVVVLLLFHPFAVIKNATPALIGFIVLYFAQFFINLDSKPDEDDEDEDEYEDEIEENAEAEYDEAAYSEDFEEAAEESAEEAITEDAEADDKEQ